MKKTSIYLGITILSLFLMVSQVSAQYEKQNNLNQSFRASLAPSADIEDFRSEFDKLLADMQHVFRLYMEIPGFRRSMERSGIDPAPKFEEARQLIRVTKPDQLAQIREIIAKQPEFGEIPRLLRSLIDENYSETLESKLKLRESGVELASLIPDPSCTAVSDLGVTYNDIEAAKDLVVIASQAVDSCDPCPFLKIFLVGARALVEIAVNFLEKVSDKDTACTIDEIKESTGGVDEIANDVKQILRTGAKEATVLTRSSQFSVNVLQSSVDDVEAGVTLANAKLDDLLTNLAAFQAQNLRFQIEDNLANGNHDAPIAQFELPEAQGGYLNLVRSIVVDTLNKLQAAGQDIGNAASFLNNGDEYRAAGEYKKAYKEYRKAYEMATK